jgi:hypothetical protein
MNLSRETRVVNHWCRPGSVLFDRYRPSRYQNSSALAAEAAGEQPGKAPGLAIYNEQFAVVGKSCRSI